MIKANNIIMKEQIWISLVTSKIETELLESEADARLHTERIIAPSLQMNSTREMMKCGHPGNFPLCEHIEGVQDCTSECPRSQVGPYPHHKRPECLVQVKGE